MKANGGMIAANNTNNAIPIYANTAKRLSTSTRKNITKYNNAIVNCGHF
jgi:hypothetical protein